MNPVDGQDVNLLNYYKDNKIPHTWQCADCGGWLGLEPYPKEHAHNWVVRDLRPFEKVENGIQDETIDRDSSVQ